MDRLITLTQARKKGQREIEVPNWEEKVRYIERSKEGDVNALFLIWFLCFPSLAYL